MALNAALGAWLTVASAAIAQGGPDPEPLAPPEPVMDVNPFRKTYLSVEMARNYPMAFTQNRYEPGRFFPAFAYLHDLDENWLMGLGAQFKILNKKELDPADVPEGESNSGFLGLWTVSHQTMYVVRLNHPTYVLVGPKILYLLPTRSAKLPLQREPSLSSEIGGALSIGLTRVVRDHFLLTMRAERWRGTRTMKLHGFEIAFGIAYGFD
jgi:hypothetical protein